MTTGSMAFQIPVPIRGFGATTSLPMATHNSSRKTFGCISNKCYFPSWERTHIAMFFFKKSWFLLKSQIRAKNLGRFSIARLVSNIRFPVFPLVKLPRIHSTASCSFSKLSVQILGRNFKMQNFVKHFEVKHSVRPIKFINQAKL